MRLRCVVFPRRRSRTRSGTMASWHLSSGLELGRAHAGVKHLSARPILLQSSFTTCQPYLILPAR